MSDVIRMILRPSLRCNKDCENIDIFRKFIETYSLFWINGKAKSCFSQLTRTAA